MALINGRNYDWSMIQFNFSNIQGTTIMGISAINYSEEQDSELQYGVGTKAIGRGLGNEKAEGSITMDMNTVVQLQNLTPTGKLIDLGEFDLVVTFNHPESDKTIVHTLKNCIILQQGVEVSQNDMKIEKEFNLNPGSIEWGDSSLVG